MAETLPPMTTGSEHHPLLHAFTTLVLAAEPERADRILRHSIKLLIEDSPARRLGSRKDGERWAGIRTQLRERMKAERITAMGLAQQLGISESVVDKCSAPHGPTPSDAVIAKIEDWLCGRQPAINKPSSAKISIAAIARSAANGADHARSEGPTAGLAATTGQTAVQKNPSSAKAGGERPKPVPSSPLGAASSPAAVPLPTGRVNCAVGSEKSDPTAPHRAGRTGAAALTPGEVARLETAAAALGDLELRRRLALGAEALDAALTGRAVAVEIAERVRAFLAA